MSLLKNMRKLGTAIVAQSKSRCYMNAATRKRFGIVYDEKGAVAPYNVAYHGHRARKSVKISIRKCPRLLANLLEVLHRSDVLFLDKGTIAALGCKVGNRVQISI